MRLRRYLFHVDANDSDSTFEFIFKFASIMTMIF